MWEDQILVTPKKRVEIQLNVTPNTPTWNNMEICIVEVRHVIQAKKTTESLKLIWVYLQFFLH